MSNFIATIPGPVTDTYDSEVIQLGELYAESGKIYRFVKFVDEDSAVNKFAVRASDTAWEVTIDYSDGSAIGGDGLHIGVGMTLATVDISEKPYGWVQCSGDTEFLAGSVAIVAGDFLIPDDGTNGALEEGDGTAGDTYAQALETVADTKTGTCTLRNCL